MKNQKKIDLRSAQFYSLLTLSCFLFLVSGCKGSGGSGDGGVTTTAPTTTTPQPSNAAGTWRGTITFTEGTGNLEITLVVQKASVQNIPLTVWGRGVFHLSSSYYIDSAIAIGTITGSNLDLTVVFSSDKVSCSFSGTVSENTLSGKWGPCSDDSNESATLNLTKILLSSELPNIAGTWKFSEKGAVIVFTQDGEFLSGTYTCPSTTPCFHSNGTVTGTVSGNTFTAMVVFPDGHSFGFFNVEISGNTITGFIGTDEPLVEGTVETFTLTKQ